LKALQALSAGPFSMVRPAGHTRLEVQAYLRVIAEAKPDRKITLRAASTRLSPNLTAVKSFS